MIDPIADMIIRIKNAYAARHQDVEMPHSKIKQVIAEKLETLGYVKDVTINETETRKTIAMNLVYKNKMPVVNGIKRISTPGRRSYVGRRHIPVTLSGYGSTILSTSKGVMTDKEARQAGVGGEIICQIW